MRKKILAVLLTGAFACSILAGCGSSASSSTASSTAAATSVAETTASSSVETTDAKASVDAAGGFTENPIFEGADLNLLTMNAVWFQAVPMSGGYEDIGDNNIHIEADISANENTLGFGKGDWIPYLQVSYVINDASTGNEVVSGNFMPMSASDGPHYGANIKLDAGTYNLTINVSPQEDVYLIHLDSETGPGGTWDDYFKDGALSYTYENWEFEGYSQ